MTQPLGATQVAQVTMHPLVQLRASTNRTPSCERLRWSVPPGEVAQAQCTVVTGVAVTEVLAVRP